jgi:uncharacterized membrane protein
MKQLGRVTNLVLMGFSVLIGAMSVKLGIGNPSDMGPGFMPFVACILLFCCVSFVFVLELKTTIEREKRVMEKQRLVKPTGLCLVILGYMFLLKVLGYPVTAFVALFAISSLSAPRGWVANAVFAGTLAAVTYTLFNWLGLGLPSGVFGMGW